MLCTNVFILALKVRLALVLPIPSHDVRRNVGAGFNGVVICCVAIPSHNILLVWPLPTWRIMWSNVDSLQRFVIFWGALCAFAQCVRFDLVYRSRGTPISPLLSVINIQGLIRHRVFSEWPLCMPWLLFDLRSSRNHFFLALVQVVHGQLIFCWVFLPCRHSCCPLWLRGCEFDPDSTVVAWERLDRQSVSNCYR